MLGRWIDLWNRRQLLFTPPQKPKYLNNKLRVFKPSLVLQTALALLSIYSLFQFQILYSASSTHFTQAK